MTNIVIIGGGATSVALMLELAHSAEVLRNCGAPQITLFSGGGRAGPGEAFGTSCILHKVNTPPSLMGLTPNHNDDFLVWLDKQPQYQSDDQSYLPRAEYAKYLTERLESAIKQLQRANIDVDVHCDLVSEVRVRNDKLQVRSKNTSWLTSDYMIYAPGHPALPNFPQLQDHPGFKLCPSPEAINHYRIAIIGSGLTAVDKILELIGSGYQGKIDCYSRNAMLPTVQSAARLKNIYPHYLSYENLLALRSRKGCLTCTDLIRSLNLDLRRYPDNEVIETAEFDSNSQHAEILSTLIQRAKVGNLPLQGLLQATRPYSHLVWQMLSSFERKVFMQSYQRQWDIWRHAIPLHSAETVCSALKSGQVSIHKLEGIRLADRDIVVKNPAGQTRYQEVIDATGGHNRVMETHDPFLKSALSLGVIRPATCGGVEVNVRNFSALADRSLETQLFALGQIAKGDLFSTNALWFNRDCAQIVARNIVQHISETQPGRYRRHG